MKFQCQICQLFSIQYPVVQGGMVWVSGGKLAAAVANSGGLGLIGAGSMGPELLQEHIEKAKSLVLPQCSGAIGVNIPLLYSKTPEQIEVALKAGIKIFFTSAGSPKKYTSYLKDKGAIVVHVTSHPDLARKCEKAGVDAVVAEGFEAGGHNGRDEITTMGLIPQVVDSVSIPVIAAGGIFDGRQMAAAMCLGAQGVQIGTGFAATQESSAHDHFKQAIVSAHSSSTKLLMKKHVPVRLLANDFSQEVEKRESEGASPEELIELLGKGRAKRGMLEGDLSQGELEIGQVSAMVKEIPTVSDYMTTLINSYQAVVGP